MKQHLLYGVGLVLPLCITTSAIGLPLYHVTVSQDHTGDYQSIQAALADAPDNETPYVVYIKNGIYHEKLHIQRPNVYLIGEDREQTVITATTANSMLKPDGNKFGTFGSRTVSVDAPNFRARSLTIENAFDFPANQAKADNDPTKQKGTQAVALLVSYKGEHAQFKDVKISSYQDTLYIRAGTSYFDQSYITGTVDFIFGHGTALIDRSQIVARNRYDVANGNRYGYITAPSTSIDHPFGLVFRDSALTKEAGVPAHSYGLGRPWHPTTTFPDGRYADPNAIGHTAYLNCSMDDHIDSWDKMSGKDINGNKIWFYPEDSRFWEYHTTGAGTASGQDSTRPQLTDAQAITYTANNILGWTPDISLGKQSQIVGQVIHRQMMFPAKITLKDSLGQTRTTETDMNGYYRLSASGMTAPLLVSADDQTGQTCLKRDQFRSVCASALIAEPKNNGITRGNINALSDVIVSKLAIEAGLKGPEHLVHADNIPALSQATWRQAVATFDKAMKPLIEKYGLDSDKSWDPTSYDDAYQPVITEVASQIIHQREHDSDTGLASTAKLLDLAFHPLSLETLDTNQLEKIQKRVTFAHRRIFLVGDSTVSNYPEAVFPRMGWGQALDAALSHDYQLQVINAAQSGRSSRDFINARWFSALKPFAYPGDYLLIQFGHNDEKCDGAKAPRGPLDVAVLCTYPNDADGKPQFPKGHPEYSFQHSLERYLTFARIYGLRPILITPVPRAKTEDNQPGTPIRESQHITKQNSKQGYAFYGDYSQTVKDTAAAHHIQLIDLQTLVRDAANKLPENGWRQWWLSVDTDQYPYYKNRTGRHDKPDTTHFQKQGAEAIADIVVRSLRSHRRPPWMRHFN